MKQPKHILLLILRIAIATGLLVYLVFSDSIEWSSLKGLSVAWPLTTVAFLLYFVAIIITAWRLCFLLRPFGLHLTIFTSTRLTLIGSFFNLCLPGSTGGDLVKIHYATLHNHGRRTEVATILVFDRVIGMFSMLIFPLLIAPLFPHLIEKLSVLRSLLWFSAFVAGILFIIILAGITYNLENNKYFSRILKKLPLASYLRNILSTIYDYRKSRRCLLVAFLQSLVALFLTLGTTLLIAKATNPAGFMWGMSILVQFGFFANTLPITPGGIGVGEAAFDKLFVMAGFNGGAETILGWRIITLMISLIGLFFYLQGRRRFVHQLDN